MSNMTLNLNNKKVCRHRQLDELCNLLVSSTAVPQTPPPSPATPQAPVPRPQAPIPLHPVTASLQLHKIPLNSIRPPRPRKLQAPKKRLERVQIA